MENFLASEHDTFSIQRSYFLDTGLIQQPVAGKTDFTQECAFIQLYSPIEEVMIVWSATSQGTPPIIPDPTTLLTDPNVVFLRQGQVAVVPIPRPSGQGHYWAASCVYYYGLKVPRRLRSPMRTGVVFGDPSSTATDGQYDQFNFYVIDPRQ